jgi:hypothetical protein
VQQLAATAEQLQALVDRFTDLPATAARVALPRAA